MYRSLQKLILISFFVFTFSLCASDYEEMIGGEVISFSQVDAFGNHFDMDDYIGRNIVVSIGDKKSDLEHSLWNDWKNLFVFSPDTIFINIYFPGGISFTVPRGEVVHRIRRSINNRKKEILNSVTKDKKNFLSSLDIHWIIDWKRKITRRFHAPRHNIISFFVDKDGIVRDYYMYNENSLSDFLKTVKEFQKEDDKSTSPGVL